MRILIVGLWEDWVTTTHGSFEIRSASTAGEAIELMLEWKPDLAVVDPMIVGRSRDALVSTAESLGVRVLGTRAPAIRIPGSTIEELEKYAILETLKAVGGSTSRATKLLGISTRKIQYRLRDWQTSKPAGGAQSRRRSLIRASSSQNLDSSNTWSAVSRAAASFRRGYFAAPSAGSSDRSLERRSPPPRPNAR